MADDPDIVKSMNNLITTLLPSAKPTKITFETEFRTDSSETEIMEHLKRNFRPMTETIKNIYQLLIDGEPDKFDCLFKVLRGGSRKYLLFRVRNSILKLNIHAHANFFLKFTKVSST